VCVVVVVRAEPVRRPVCPGRPRDHHGVGIFRGGSTKRPTANGTASFLRTSQPGPTHPALLGSNKKRRQPSNRSAFVSLSLSGLFRPVPCPSSSPHCQGGYSLLTNRWGVWVFPFFSLTIGARERGERETRMEHGGGVRVTGRDGRMAATCLHVHQFLQPILSTWPRHRAGSSALPYTALL